MFHLKRDSGSCCSSSQGMIGVSFKSVNRTFTYSALIFLRRFSASQCLSSKGDDAVTPRHTRPFSAGPSRIRKNSLPFGKSVRLPQNHRSVTKPLRRIRAISFRSVSQGYFSGFQDSKNAAIRCALPLASTPANIAPEIGRDLVMRWYHYIAYFFGGAFLANAVPHFVNGVSGNPFQSPFASPPGEGLSSSTINVLWGLLNLAVAYALICRVGSFNLRKTTHVLTLGAGILIMSLMLARTFGRFPGGL